MKIPADKIIHETRNTSYWFHDDLLFMVAKKCEPLTLEETKKNTESLRAKLDGKKVSVVIDLSNSTPSSKESRSYSQKIMPELFKAMALIVSSPFSRMLATVQLGTTSLPFPAKIFSDEKVAIEWLKNIEKKD